MANTDVNMEEIETNDANINSDSYEDSFDSKRRVRFPEDENIVSHYFEAKEYWNESRFCSAEELINGYKKACERYSIKPIPIVLEQIKGIDMNVCQERYEMLNVTNVKMDLKHIESFEEIFKRVQFKTLIFENCNLDDDSSGSLFDMIEYYETCLKLNISHNPKITFIGFNYLSKMLKKTACLDTLEMKGVMFTESTVPALNRALRCGSHLRVLHLEYSNICSKNLLILSSALKLNVFLRELHLSGNRLVPSDGIQLGSLLKINRHLEMLDVRNNSLGDVGLSHICDGLCGQFLPHNNNINHNSNTTAIDDSQDNGRGLLCLILWGNSITYNGMPALSDALKIHQSLQSLNLGNNPILSEGVHALREGLLSNRSLIRLSLPCCKVTCEGGVAIAEYLADTRQLMRLDLRENDIKTAGLMAISLSMRVNKSVTRLDIDQISKRDGNVKGYAESQLESLKLIQQRIQENKRMIIEQHEMELTQSLQSLSNSFENQTTTTSGADDANDNDLNNSNGDEYSETTEKDEDTVEEDENGDDEKDIDQNSNSICDNLLIKQNNNETPVILPFIDPTSDDIPNPPKDLPILNLNLAASINDTEKSKDNDDEDNGNNPNNSLFADKLLSPTDTLLELKLDNCVVNSDSVDDTNVATAESSSPIQSLDDLFNPIKCDNTDLLKLDAEPKNSTTPHDSPSIPIETDER